MTFSTIRTGKLLIATVFAFALLTSASQAYSPEQEQMCTGDAMRLCGSEIPDVERVTACMIQKRASLSDGCKAVFRYEPPGGNAGKLRAVGKAVEAAEPDPEQARLNLASALYKVRKRHARHCLGVALDRFAGS